MRFRLHTKFRRNPRQRRPYLTQLLPPHLYRRAQRRPQPVRNIIESQKPLFDLRLR